MISWRTLQMLLLAGLAGLALQAWSLGRQDVCSAHLAGLPGPATQIVDQGKRSVEVPCQLWFPRQPIAAQAIYLLAGALGLAGLVSFAMDLVRWRRAARRPAAGEESGP